jgi:HprK-related kinase A
MPLKNESIDVMRWFAPDAWIGPSIAGTRKGTIAHVRPPAAAVTASDVSARPRWLVFPQWQAGAPLDMPEVARIDAFALLATNAFNYEVLGEAGFRTIRSLVEASRCYRLTYSRLDDAIAAINQMADSHAA